MGEYWLTVEEYWITVWNCLREGEGEVPLNFKEKEPTDDEDSTNESQDFNCESRSGSEQKE